MQVEPYIAKAKLERRFITDTGAQGFRKEALFGGKLVG
jgi:hypothetical protein